MGPLVEVLTSFTLGLATPLSAVCVVPLYPGFLAFLSNQREDAPSVAVLAVLVTTGVIGFMSLVGVVFTTVLQTSLTGVIGVVSPVAFALLALYALVLVAGGQPWALLPTVEPPQSRYPSVTALLYGAFFGAIVLPCNPGFISVFFARALLVTAPLASMANFGAFGVGMGTPLLAFGVVSQPWRDRVLGLLTENERPIEVISGVLLFSISLYYLLVVFGIGPSVWVVALADCRDDIHGLP